MAIQTSANNQVTVLSASWNSATTPYTALKVDVNNILTPTGSLLFDVGTNTGTYTSRFAIDVSGSVGVGTAAPSGKFEVVGVSGSLLLVTDALSGSLFSVNDITGLPIFEVFSDDTVVAGAVNSNALVVTGSRVGIGSRTPGYVLDVAPTTATARVGTTLLGAWPANTSYAFFGHNSLTQTGSGNYAIIQSNAGSTFVNAASGNTLSLRINDTAALTVDSSRYVGIGTVTPGTALHVRDASLTEQLRLMGSGAGYMYAGYDQANNRGKFGAYTGASFTNLLINEGGGNVGIGVNTNPVTTLDVNGVINTATGFRIANAATPAGRYLRADGTNFVSSAIVAGDVPTLNQNTTGQAGSVANAVTFNNGGAGDASGTTFNGSAARTISYNTV